MSLNGKSRKINLKTKFSLKHDWSVTYQKSIIIQKIKQNKN